MKISVGRPVAIVLGAGEIGSAVALALHRAGLAVVISDEVDPSWSRRGMAYADAWYVGTAQLDFVAAMFCASVKSIPTVLDRHRQIAATTWSACGVAQSLEAVAIIDARMRKRNDNDDLRAPALTTVGLGPGFVAKGNVDLAVETAWGAQLGAVIHKEPALPPAGESRRIGGAGRERFVHAPAAGWFTTDRRIAGRVLKGEVIGAIGTQLICAPLGGVLRGLSARGARVQQGTRIVEVDPRGDPALCFGIGERPLAIARGVIAGLAARGVLPTSARAFSGDAAGPYRISTTNVE
jgi:xanthine dehydrogenase accessory factor